MMIFDKYHAITILISMLAVVAVVSVHYEGLRYFTKWLSGDYVRPRLRVVFTIYGLLTLHILEIWIFGMCYWWLHTGNPGYGALVSAEPLTYVVDYVYFSATVYSTLGFGDIVPQGPIRFLAGIESLTGLLLITWSASFTYLEMIQYWRKRD